MKLYSYILRYDTGFAPNPFNDFCTLACCKPVIRRKANPGDLILGLTPKSLGHKVAYAMEVSECLTFSDYWADARFIGKRPDWLDSEMRKRVGDNCYQPTAQGDYRQLPSIHSHSDGAEDAANKTRDLRGKRVLIAMDYWYWGNESIPLPKDLSFLKIGSGHRSNFTQAQIDCVESFLKKRPKGLHGAPRDWPEHDNSWMSGSTRNCRGRA